MERLTEASLKWCSTYEIGRVAAKHFSDPNQFNGMTTELTTWEGSVHDLASAMEEVTNQKTVGKLAMPKFFRRLFLGCLITCASFLRQVVLSKVLVKTLRPAYNLFRVFSLRKIGYDFT